MTERVKNRRRWLAPEVVQTSNMDCGPAALKCLLEGYGVHASYGRLREACQTDVDGTSIDALEEIAGKLGLEAEQPLDYLLIPDARALPAIVVVRLPSGGTHFVVLWRRHGNLSQIMDPALGRRWVDGASVSGRDLRVLHGSTPCSVAGVGWVSRAIRLPPRPRTYSDILSSAIPAV